MSGDSSNQLLNTEEGSVTSDCSVILACALELRVSGKHFIAWTSLGQGCLRGKIIIFLQNLAIKSIQSVGRGAEFFFTSWGLSPSPRKSLLCRETLIIYQVGVVPLLGISRDPGQPKQAAQMKFLREMMWLSWGQSMCWGLNSTILTLKAAFGLLGCRKGRDALLKISLKLNCCIAQNTEESQKGFSYCIPKQTSRVGNRQFFSFVYIPIAN